MKKKERGGPVSADPTENFINYEIDNRFFVDVVSICFGRDYCTKDDDKSLECKFEICFQGDQTKNGIYFYLQ